MATHDDNAYFGAGQRVDDAMAMVEEERRRLEEGSRSRKEQRTEVVAKDRSFSMTFDGRGDLVDMLFHGTKYRQAAPKELAHLIVTTWEKGRLEAIEKMAASLAERTPGLSGADVVGLATGKADPSKIVDALLAPILGDVPGLGLGRPQDGGPRG